jgi:hypothetical protein
MNNGAWQGILLITVHPRFHRTRRGSLVTGIVYYITCSSTLFQLGMMPSLARIESPDDHGNQHDARVG